MEIPDDLRHRINGWDTLSRWERSELGRDLRRLGLSYSEIQRLIEVKKSTLATWCREVKLTDTQYKAIASRSRSRKGVPVDTQWRRRAEVELIRRIARSEAERLLGDPLWMAGVVLYWAEGTKASRKLQVSHSEAAALRLFVTWTRRYHDATALFRAAVNLHANNDEVAAREYWGGELGLDPSTDFTKSYIKPDGTGHRKNHLPYGVCSMTMLRGTDSLERTLVWVEVVRSHLGG